MRDKSAGGGGGGGRGQQAAHSNRHDPATGATSKQTVGCVSSRKGFMCLKAQSCPPPEDLKKSQENTEEWLKENPPHLASAMHHFFSAFL